MPPASTQGSQRGAGGDAGTHTAPCRRGRSPPNPKPLHSPEAGEGPRPGAQAGAPTSPRHGATEASLLPACSPGRLRCLSKTFYHQRVLICSASRPAPCIYLPLHTQTPSRMKVHLLSADPNPPRARGCIHTTISSSRNQELESGPDWQDRHWREMVQVGSYGLKEPLQLIFGNKMTSA